MNKLLTFALNPSAWWNKEDVLDSVRIGELLSFHVYSYVLLLKVWLIDLTYHHEAMLESRVKMVRNLAIIRKWEKGEITLTEEHKNICSFIEDELERINTNFGFLGLFWNIFKKFVKRKYHANRNP